MAFRGLFVGVDRYASPRIGWLNCAARDATALHALFSDNLGPGADLLVDEKATRASIEAAFEVLRSCAEDDVVVVGFSGHGSESHELVTFDADPHDLARTAIPLVELTEWFSRIPSRRLLCLLDCCFSGEAGAKVLKTDTRARSMDSTEVLLNQMSGEGRLILTASTATQEAFEDATLGHGLLSYFVMEALQGADEVRKDGKVSIYRLLDHVADRVTSKARLLGQAQHPTVRGQIDEKLSWPVFVQGERYAAAFPQQVRPRATSDIRSLLPFGFPEELLHSWAAEIPSLNQLQLDAINEFGVLDNANLVVSAPTSSGKTMIAELAALKGALERRRAFFLLPMRALVNDKYHQFQRTYSGFGIKTIRATGEISDDLGDLMRGQYDVCLMTYEKFSNLALTNPHILHQVGTVVIDEVQMIVDPSRGANLEFLMTYLLAQRAGGVKPQLIALSAVIGDTNGLERWLDARLLRREERPVPLKEGVLRMDGTWRYVSNGGEEHSERRVDVGYGRGTSQDLLIPLVRTLLSEGKQVIVFRESKGETTGCARYLSQNCDAAPARRALDRLPQGDPSISSAALGSALEGGVAFHNADLTRDERMVIEDEFRAPDAQIRVIVATTTLAMGVNTPAAAVVVAGLVHPGSNEAYTVAEYKNMVGRAGRLGYSEEGESYLLALTGSEEYTGWNGYVQGTPEDIQSKFFVRGTDPRTHVLRVLGALERFSQDGLTAEEVVNFIESSFGAFQERERSPSWQWSHNALQQIIAALTHHEFIHTTDSGGLRLTPLGRLAGEGACEVESLIRLSRVIRSLHVSEFNVATLVTLTQLTAELTSLIFPFNRRSKHKEPQSWQSVLVQQGVSRQVLGSMALHSVDGHTATLRMKKAGACLYWMSDHPLESIERTMTRHGGGFGGAAGPIRAVAERTRDLVPAVARAAEIIHPEMDDLSLLVQRLLVRLEIGLPAEVAELALHIGTRLSRSDYHRLLRSALTDKAAIEAAEDEALLACLDNEETVAMVRATLADSDEGDDDAIALPVPTE